MTLLKNCKVLVIGGAGTIGSAVTLEIFKRNPKSLHVVDISENNLVELVRILEARSVTQVVILKLLRRLW